jgi:hypothetical protein
MKKTDSSFRTLGLITLFLVLAIIQISYGIVMLSNQFTKSKIDVRIKVAGASFQSLKTEDIPFIETVIKDHDQNNATHK